MLDGPLPPQKSEPSMDEGSETKESEQQCRVASGECEKKPVVLREVMVEIGSDRSLFQALAPFGIPKSTLQRLEQDLPKKISKGLRPGQKVRLVFGDHRLVSLKIYRDMVHAWLIEGQKSGRWICKNVKVKLALKYERVRLPVTETLKKALLSSGMHRELMLDMAKTFGQSGIVWGNLRGASVHVMYQKIENPETKACRLGHVEMIRIEQKKNTRTYYAHQMSQASRRAFYTLAEFSVGGGGVPHHGASDTWTKPVDKAQITSGFGHRRHPIYGCKKHHNGVDYGGKHGSPIKAVSSGVVVSVKHNGSYGRYVKIAHRNGYQTLYAHLSSCMVRVGQRVRTGQTIGGMGSTGRATGTHLHLEVSKNGRVLDPLKVLASAQRKAPIFASRRGFSVDQKKKFYAQAQMLNKRYGTAGGGGLPSSSGRKVSLKERKRGVSVPVVRRSTRGTCISGEKKLHKGSKKTLHLIQ